MVSDFACRSCDYAWLYWLFHITYYKFFYVQSYDGGFGLVPGLESHGGATYCAVAALRLMEFIEDDRQAIDGGFQGRANKATDTLCFLDWWYTENLGVHYGNAALREFLLTCQSKVFLLMFFMLQYGGFSKFLAHLPDLYHAYFGFAAFSLLEEPGINTLSSQLGITNLESTGF
ncbi:hypothetical protein MKW94_004807 [Papaver nudicaule]|uniref:Prenyltransferase alpha-alpha toroid domain-containing protein n=1 Tax=Papaver nudicaule TaxID=74823 RepID=A0AA41V602_PAPNU|nr:hypothetical protein [Papaver nudicaule]